jgi:hypothetical protein
VPDLEQEIEAMEFFSVLTLGLGPEVATLTHIVTATNGATREEVFQYMKKTLTDQLGPRWDRSNVVFFSAEPNTLGAAR